MNAHTPMSLVSDSGQQTTPQHSDILPTHDAQDLTKGGVQAQIMLGHQTYFLRITRAGKLILTK